MNIGDIAEMAGVSRAAVSRYLNNGYISAEKKERIRRVIEETGYQPSVMAQTLRTKKTRLVGVILPRIHSDSISSMVAGIGAVLNREGYDMLLATSDNNPDKELDFLRIFSNNRVDGIILIATVLTEAHKNLIADLRVPVVIAGQVLEGCCCISHDDFHAGKELTELLLSEGRRQIAYIGVLKEDIAVGVRRYEGYLEAMHAAGLDPPGESFGTADFSVESGSGVMKEILRKYPEADAVIGATDSIALGAMLSLREAGHSIPGDTAVAGFGDNLIARVTTPGLTTVHYYYRECGEEAGAKIIAQIEGSPDGRENVQLGFELVRRDSV